MQASNYRYKSSIYQTPKLDKENENAPAKRRTLCMSDKGKYGAVTMNTKIPAIPVEQSKSPRSYNKSRTPTVWERLSKVKKVSNPSDIPCSRQRQHMNGFNNSQVMRKPLFPTGTVNAKRYTNNSRSISPSTAKEAVYTMETKAPIRKAVMLPIIESELTNQAFIYICNGNMVKDIMTPRSLSDSKSSKSLSKSDDPQNTNEHIPIKAIEEDDIELSLSVHQRDNHCDELSSSRTIITNFRDILRRKQNSSPPPEEELNVLKTLIKSDERHTELHKNNSTLFKDILKTQLKSIVHHEAVVKNALNKLDCVDEFVASQLVQTESAYGTPLGSARSSSSSSDEEKPNKLEVDVIFKNVPSFEKEITLLRTIGEKLNATLNNNLSPRTLPIEPVISTPTTSIPLQLSGIIKSHDPIIYEYIMHSAMKIMEHNATVTVHTQYIALNMGIVREFLIAQRTIVELKEEDNKPFYIPTNAELKRTSFRKLKENPDILMRYIKPKNTLVPFNILDQDPIFFNNIFFNKNASKPSINMGIQDDIVGLTESAVSVVLTNAIGDGNGDGCTIIKDASKPLNMQQSEILQPHEKCSISNKTSTTVNEYNSAQSQIPGDGAVPSDNNANCDKNHSNISVRVKRSRKRIRKNVTPMSVDYRERVEPKNHLLRTILIGTVQISVFIFLIMTFTYPGPKC